MTVFEYLGRMLCPQSCVCCGKAFDFFSNEVFCSECYGELLTRIIDAPSDKKLQYVDKSYHYILYNSWYAKKIIRHTKYVGSKDFFKFMGEQCSKSMHNHNLAKSIDAITYTPRRSTEVRLYTFDQAKGLATAASNSLGIPCRDYLKRKGFSLPQKWMKGSKRQVNAKGKYVCIQEVTDKRILLIDDIMTTGSTVNECARLLKENGAKEVYVWTIAK